MPDTPVIEFNNNRCGKCGSETFVIDSRDSPTGYRRRRKCLKCPHRTTTYEISAAELTALLRIRKQLEKSIGSIPVIIKDLQTIATVAVPQIREIDQL